MSINEESIFNSMLQALVFRHGVLLNSKQCAKVLGISTRTLDERRKASKDCPAYIQNGDRLIGYPAQNIVQYQLNKAKQSIRIA